ncbi:ATP-binding protein [Planobispora siamensis]|uniref:ATP-binding protein n=1 Tax=Planobispora siamensis TaxID=936338 RepID=UPI00194FAE06|nr:ATP-binding protein [Planobispora siamensis]
MWNVVRRRLRQVPWAQAAPAVLAAALVAVVGLVLSGLSGAVLQRAQQRTADQGMDRRAALVNGAVTAEAGRYVDALRMMAAAMGASEPLTRARFVRLTRPLQQMRLAGASSIVFLVAAGDEDVPRVQEEWRERGAAGLNLAAEGTGREHIFSIFNEPLNGNRRQEAGIDATQAAEPSQALTEARRSGQVTVSDTYYLLGDRDLPAEHRQLSFVLTVPIHTETPADGGRRRFVGWVLMALHGQDFIGETLQRITQGTFDVRLRARHSGGAVMTVATLTATGARRSPPDMSRTGEVRVAQRTWQLEVAAAGASLPGASGALPATVATTGTVVSLLLAALVFVLAGSRARARAQVVAATAELRAAEAGARRQSGLLAAVLDSVGDGVGVIDEKGRFLLHNPAARQILGIDHDLDDIEEWQRRYGVFTPDGSAPIPTGELPVMRALTGQKVERVSMMIRHPGRPEGAIISVSAQPLDPAAGQTGAVAVFHDITDRTRADERLAAASAALQEELVRRTASEAELRVARDELAVQKAYLTQVLDAIDVNVITCDLDGVIVHANRVARSALPPADRPLTIAETTPVVHMTYSDGSAMTIEQTPLMRALRGEVVDLEMTVTPPGCGRQIVMMHARPLRHTDGNLIGAVASSYNITALREREAELQAFAGVVAHDLKRPLSAVRGFAELVYDDLAEEAEPAGPGATGPDATGPGGPRGATGRGGGRAALRMRHLDRVLSATARMSRLIDDLLLYAAARDAAVNPQTVDLDAMAREVVAEHVAAAGADRAGPAPQVYVGTLPHVLADPPLVRQLVDNLIGNAIKYTPPGQAPRVDVTPHPAPEGWACVEVADRGIGIPPGQHQAIFAGFHRVATAYSGTGLGLAICRRVVERHGGTIVAEDNPGGGARFRFTLPAAPQP